MKKLYIFENPCCANSHKMKILWYLQKACGRKWESNNQFCLALLLCIIASAKFSYRLGMIANYSLILKVVVHQSRH